MIKLQLKPQVTQATDSGFLGRDAGTSSSSVERAPKHDPQLVMPWREALQPTTRQKTKAEKIQWLWVIFFTYLAVRSLFAAINWFFTYNMAYIGILVTGGYGTHILSKVMEQYPVERILKINNQFGLKEHVGNKPDLISSLAAAIESKELILHDFDAVDQLKHFKRSRNGRLEAETGWHDDHVSAAYMGVRTARFYPQSLKPLKQGMIDRRNTYQQRSTRRNSGMDSWGGYSAC